MYPEIALNEDLIKDCEPVIAEIFGRCAENAPNFGLQEKYFNESVTKTIRRFISSSPNEKVSFNEVKDFLQHLQADDLFMTLACANGSERAWWEFDQNHRAYMERVAHHLAKNDVDARDVIDTVYVELYGTRVVDGERFSKFAMYSGRGNLRGWLRTVIWHSLVDMHRASHDEISLDAMTENVGEGMTHSNFAESISLGGEDEMIEHLTKERYRRSTLAAIETAFTSLENHEKLLLLYYHVENLKLREIARLVENENSPLRGWFQRKSTSRDKDPASRIYESTIMRWMEKCYAKILQTFRIELQTTHKFNEQELEICLELATQDLAGQSVYRNLTTTAPHLNASE